METPKHPQLDKVSESSAAPAPGPAPAPAPAAAAFDWRGRPLNCSLLSSLSPRQELLNEAKRAFHLFDEQDQGRLDRNQVKSAIFYLCGYVPSKNELNRIFDEVGDEHVLSAESKRIGLNGFLSEEVFVGCLIGRMLAIDPLKYLHQLFQAFDTDDRGFIAEEDLALAFQRIAPELSRGTIKRIFSAVDLDSNGKVSFKEFQSAMKETQT